MKQITILFLLFSTMLFSQNSNINSVKIGNVEWMKENLNVSTFANGDTIMQATNVDDWKQASIEKKAAWCYYNFSEENGKKYGKLYNWYAVSDGRGLAPKGWKIPKESDYASLDVKYGYKAGIRLKSNSNWDTWESIDVKGVKKTISAVGDNSSGFTGLPGGCIDQNGVFFNKGIKAFFWTSSEKDPNSAINRGLRNDEVFVFNFSNKGFGYSVRCIK
jgi:uncharacterized protein (TIGR02145 family)